MVLLKNYLWLLPFISFLLGYFILSTLYRTKKLEMPPLIGKSLQDAATLASSYNLNLRLIEQKDDAELPNNTIINQNPKAHTMVKPNQTVFCSISKKPIITAPQLVSKKYEAALAELKDLGIHGNYYFFESNYPKDFCFAQSPHAQTVLETKSMLLYIAAGSTRPVLFPNFKHKPVVDVIDFLKPSNINPTIVHHPQKELHECTNSCIVVDQRPLPGSLVILNPEKPLQVQLQVSSF